MTARIERRIFVVGVPRSGTTLVQSLLATHSAVTSFTESHFFSRHFRMLPGLSTPLLLSDPVPRLRQFLAENGVDESDQRAILANEAAGISAPRLLLALGTNRVAHKLLAVLDRMALDRARSNWVEKTAQHLHYVPFLERLHATDTTPAAHFVHVIRDGLEVVSSLLVASRRWEPRRYPFARGAVPPYDLETCVHRWNADVALSLRRLDSPANHFVFYEDLTADPETTVRHLLTGLGLAWEPGILEDFVRTADGLITRRETWKRIDSTLKPSATSHQTLNEAQRDQVSRSLRHDLYRRLHDSAGIREA